MQYINSTYSNKPFFLGFVDFAQFIVIYPHKNRVAAYHFNPVAVNNHIVLPAQNAEKPRSAVDYNRIDFSGSTVNFHIVNISYPFAVHNIDYLSELKLRKTAVHKTTPYTGYGAKTQNMTNICRPQALSLC